MQATLDNLPKLWQQSLTPIYWIAGDEPLQLMEAKQSIRTLAQQSGFSERETLYSDQDFKWEHLLDSGASMSLFAEKRLIELNLAQLPDKNAQKILLEYQQRLSDDVVLVIFSPKVEKRIQSNKWFKQLSSSLTFVAVWPLAGPKLIQGLQQRAQKAGIELQQDAAQWLAVQIEGNLLAAHQEIQKLALIMEPGSQVTLAQLQQQVTDQARFDVFNLLESAVAGDAVKTCRILHSLKSEGASEMSLLALLARELRILDKASHLSLNRQLNNQAWMRMGVWQQKQANYAKALQRYPATLWQKLLFRVLRIEKMFKGMEPGDFWLEMERLLLLIAGKTL